MQRLVTRFQQIRLIQYLQITLIKLRMLKYSQNLFVKLHPGQVALVILVLEAKVPSLPEASCPTHEVKQLLAHGLVIQTELQLRVQGADLHWEHLSWLLSPKQTHFDKLIQFIRYVVCMFDNSSVNDFKSF